MARVLIVGIDPDEVDFSDPAVPPGMDADKVRQGIKRALDDLKADGHEVRSFYTPTDPTEAVGVLAKRLADAPADCLVVGGGIRMIPRHLELFEAVLNTTARAEGPPRIALVSRPEDAASAVARALG